MFLYIYADKKRRVDALLVFIQVWSEPMLLMDLHHNYFRSIHNTYLLPLHHQSVQVLHQELMVVPIVLLWC
jgi:hypothetical protein